MGNHMKASLQLLAGSAIVALGIFYPASWPGAGTLTMMGLVIVGCIIARPGIWTLAKAGPKIS
jgi:hypothetical protein